MYILLYIYILIYVYIYRYIYLQSSSHVSKEFNERRQTESRVGVGVLGG